jgi:four helix bundle protein
VLTAELWCVQPSIDVASRDAALLSTEMSDFKKLEVWRKGHALALNVHRVAVGIRGSNYAGLRSQMIRASMSIPTNIVEGNGQRSRAEFGRFISVALNSSSELEYHLIVARDPKH